MNPTIERLEALVTTLGHGLSHHALYSSRHEGVTKAANEFLLSLDRFLGDTDAPALFFQVEGGQIVLQGQPLIGATIRGRRLVELVRGNHCGGIVFSRGTSLADVLGLFSLYHLDGPARSLAEARGMLEQHGVRGVQLVDTHERPKWFTSGEGGDGGPGGGGGGGTGSGSAGASPDAKEVQSAVPLFQDMFEMVEESLGRAAGGDAVDVNAARTLGESLGQAGHYGMQNIMSLASYPDFDAYTVGHSIRVALLAVCVASRIGVEPELITELGAAGLLHDVGKA